ncbi:unnamed protein product, partial [Rotaria sordida]
MSFTNICFKCKDPENPCISFCDIGNFTCSCGHRQHSHQQGPNINDQLLKLVTDPWSDLSCNSSTEITRQKLRVKVMAYYNLKRDQCMVLNYIKAKSRQVVTAHIYPKSKSSHTKYFGLNLSDTNHPRNCLRLATEIEHAFDKKYLTIIEENGQLKIFLLNKTISSQRITTVSSHTFGDIHQAPLLFKNHNRPYHRILDKDKHSYVYQWLMNNPVGEEIQLETSRTTSSAFITNDSLLNPAATEDDEIKRLVTQSPSSTAGQDVAVLQSASSSSTYLASLDMNLIELFRMINKQQTDSNTQEEKIFQYIRETMNPSDPKYIRNIILSYVHSCVIDSNPKSIIGFDQYNARDKASIIQNILAADEEKQIEALYTTQQFVIELKHPHGMVLKLFDTFYDEECVKEEVFWNWLRRPNPAKKNDQIQLIESTKKFFIWLSQSTSSTIKDIDNDDDSSSDVDNDDDDDSSNVDKSND